MVHKFKDIFRMLPVMRNGKEKMLMRLINCAAVEMKSVRFGGNDVAYLGIKVYCLPFQHETTNFENIRLIQPDYS